MLIFFFVFKWYAEQTQYFVDAKKVRTLGGNGGDGCISFLRLWCNENAGPDGGDGGHGAHVVFQVASIKTHKFYQF